MPIWESIKYCSQEPGFKSLVFFLTEHVFCFKNNARDTNYFTKFFYKLLIWWIIISK